jgi:hypothetical protein
MKIYVVFTRYNEGEIKYIVGAFSTPEKAEDEAKKHYGEVEEFELDQPMSGC